MRPKVFSNNPIVISACTLPSHSALKICSMTANGRTAAEASAQFRLERAIFLYRVEHVDLSTRQASARCVRCSWANVCGTGRARRTAAARRGTAPPPSTTPPRRPARSRQVCTIRITRPNTSTPTSLTRSGPPRRQPHTTRHTRHTHYMHTHTGRTVPNGVADTNITSS